MEGGSVALTGGASATRFNDGAIRPTDRINCPAPLPHLASARQIVKRHMQVARLVARFLGDSQERVVRREALSFHAARTSR